MQIERTQVHITPHMHWDREWYFTAEHSRILLVNNMEEILTRLEEDDNYPFYVLDGQTAILEDYFAVKPENFERVKSLVQRGKLIIGPWYTQTDLMMVGAESITRNLLYGIRDSQVFGVPMQIGYLPDSFGMSAALPQILNEFGIEHVMFWRGCSERHGTPYTEFLWQSKDGSEVLAQILPLGYAIGKYLPDDKEALYKRLNSYLAVLEKNSFTGHLLLPNGHDQMPIQQNIFEIIRLLGEIFPDKDFLMSRYETVFEKLEAKRNSLARLEGEFNDGKYMRVHRTISSTRMDIKIANARVENTITNLLEPVASIAWSLGFDYHHGLIEKMWKEIMKNHAHDSISCCCSDDVHQEILSRFWIAQDMADNLTQFYMRKIIDNMPAVSCTHSVNHSANRDKLAFFNFLPYARTEVLSATVRIRASSFELFDENNQPVEYTICSAKEIDPGLVDRQIVHYGNYDPFMEYEIQLLAEVPAMGYRTFTLEKIADIKSVETHTMGIKKSKESRKIENQFYVIDINSNGSFRLFDKRTGQTFKDLMLLEDGSDDGDEYDYSPSREEWLIHSKEVDAKIEIIQSPLKSIAKIQLRLAVPKDLENRKLEQANSYIDVEYSITLSQSQPRIDIDLNVNNQANDHRVRLLFPFNWRTDEVIADTQFGTITRQVNDPAMAVWQEEDWKEAPIPVWQLLNFVSVEDKQAEQENGLALFTEGLREFEVIDWQDKQAIALTLFRSVGVLGKENLLLRPGRPSGIKLFTPDSQMIGKLSCRFAIQPFKGNTNSAQIMREAKAFNTPILHYNKIPYDAMKLNPASFNTPSSYSLFTETCEDLTLSALKKAEDSDALIIRFYNANSEESVLGGALQFSSSVQHSQEVNLAETSISTSSLTVNELGEFNPNQVKTVKVVFS